MNNNEEEKGIIKPSNDRALEKHDSIIHRGLRVSDSIAIETDHIISDEELSDFRERYNRLIKDIGPIPEEFIDLKLRNPHRINSAFNTNLYFQAFDKVYIQQGYTLDYIYIGDYHGGEPYLYARKSDEEPIDNEDDYFRRYPNIKPTSFMGIDPGVQGRRPYLDKMSFDKSFLGYFQFSIFCILAHRFYLKWHSNYGTHSIILTKGGLDNYRRKNTVRMSREQDSIVQEIDYHPLVKLTGKDAIVKLLSFDPFGEELCFLLVKVGWPNNYYGIETEVIIKGSPYLF